MYTPEQGQTVRQTAMTCNGWTMGDSIADMSTTKVLLVNLLEENTKSTIKYDNNLKLTSPKKPIIYKLI